jgi:hypothetical protein
MDTVVYEYKAHRAGCARTYRKSCPASMIPKALLSGEENTSPVWVVALPR